MHMINKYVFRHHNFGKSCAGGEYNKSENCFSTISIEDPPTFDRRHFAEITRHSDPYGYKSEFTVEMWQSSEFEQWCERVLADWEENAEFNSEAQMDKFKSRMLREMKTSVESSGKIQLQMVTQEQLKLQMADNAKATQEQISESASTAHKQVKALSDAVQAQHDEIQQMHASMLLLSAQMQLILQKLDA